MTSCYIRRQKSMGSPSSLFDYRQVGSANFKMLSMRHLLVCKLYRTTAVAQLQFWPG